MTRCRRCRRCSATATPLSWAITPTSSAAHECRLPGIPAPNRSGSCATSAQCRGSPAAASWHRAWRPKATTGSRSLLQNRRCSRGRRLSSVSSSRPRRRRQSQRRRLRCAVAGGRVTAPHHHRSIRLPPHRPSAPDPAPRAFSSKSSAPFLIRLRPACAQAVQETKAEGQIGPKPVADEKLDPAEVAISEDEEPANQIVAAPPREEDAVRRAPRAGGAPHRISRTPAAVLATHTNTIRWRRRSAPTRRP